ncbi:hypothetical protein EJ05DRAFT_336146 [Pseudovirgaria hyperparasitica]|uniref:Uncharacterized protein n=1 Tax=Pseudovirgaria hyperparasitica TaxID=470096 RepID=A0A6A6WDK2_9PEZI|nr:uncharacterized protein EJ05DRAFT_336146 [Pseudovirgaria hyperparasitica]KAF2759181.1 hypothetical protein EJ05DRAFT_336146 [Pseudovirgaria hyperparasitica]
METITNAANAAVTTASKMVFGEANPTTSSTDDYTTKSVAAKDTGAAEPTKDTSADIPAVKETEETPKEDTEEKTDSKPKEGSKQHPEADPTGILAHKSNAPETHFHADKPDAGDDRKEANPTVEPPAKTIAQKEPGSGVTEPLNKEPLDTSKDAKKETATSPSPSGKEKVSKLAKLKEKLHIGSKKE